MSWPWTKKEKPVYERVPDSNAKAISLLMDVDCRTVTLKADKEQEATFSAYQPYDGTSRTRQIVYINLDDPEVVRAGVRPGKYHLRLLWPAEEK